MRVPSFPDCQQKLNKREYWGGANKNSDQHNSTHDVTQTCIDGKKKVNSAIKYRKDLAQPYFSKALTDFWLSTEFQAIVIKTTNISNVIQFSYGQTATKLNIFLREQFELKLQLELFLASKTNQISWEKKTRQSSTFH